MSVMSSYNIHVYRMITNITHTHFEGYSMFSDQILNKIFMMFSVCTEIHRLKWHSTILGNLFLTFILLINIVPLPNTYKQL